MERLPVPAPGLLPSWAAPGLLPSWAAPAGPPPG